jgi:hypothetical protein
VGKIELRNRITKIYASLLTVIVVAGTFAMMTLAVPVESPDNTLSFCSSTTVVTSGVVQHNATTSISLVIGNMSISFRVVEPSRHTIITYKCAGISSRLEVIANPVGNKYDTFELLNNVVVSEKLLDMNILAPLQTSELNNQNSLSSVRDNSGITAESTYTYKWWDGIKQVVGPSYLIKYPHADRDTYQIAPWTTWSIKGNNVYHNQLCQLDSESICTLGWAGIFGFIAGAAAELVGGPIPAGAAGLLGAVLGALFGFITQAVLEDEENCLWYWWGAEFADWFAANALTMVLLGPIGVSLTAAALAQTGYLRIGDHTFTDPHYYGAPGM